MRALKTLIKLMTLAFLLCSITSFVIVPGIWLYTAANLPNTLESESDVETHLRQSIESDRQSLQITRPTNVRESPRWDKPDFSRLPKHLIAFYITAVGCPSYFQSPREDGFPWMKRIAIKQLQGRDIDGDGACELIFARNISRRLEAKQPMQLTVASDRIHRFLAKDQLVAFDLHSMWFSHGIIGVEKASDVLMKKPLTKLTLAELAEFQLAIPPYGLWETVEKCSSPSQIKLARDKLLFELAAVGLISDEMARTAASQPLRCSLVD